MRNKLYKIALAVFGIALALTFSCSSEDTDKPGNTIAYGSLEYGGQTYKTVKIGTQTWMAENLNYNANGSKCYDDDPANCVKYGRLYNLATAKTVCPPNWRLPSDEDWDILIQTVGGSSIAGIKLKATSGWTVNGENTYGFSALPGGPLGSTGQWWSNSTEIGHSEVGHVIVMSFSEYITWDASMSVDLRSVRCLEDEGYVPTPSSSSTNPSSSSTNPPSSSSGNSNLVNCQVPGACVNIELEQCLNLGGSFVASCGGNSSSSFVPSTRCKDTQGGGGEYFCQWETGCHAIDPAYADPPGQTCNDLISECNKWGKLFTNSTVEGEGKTCNGTAKSPSSSSAAAPSTRCKDGQEREYFCQWETGCHAIDPAYDPAGRSCSVMISECRNYGTLFVNSTVSGEGKTCNGIVQ